MVFHYGGDCKTGGPDRPCKNHRVAATRRGPRTPVPTPRPGRDWAPCVPIFRRVSQSGALSPPSVTGVALILRVQRGMRTSSVRLAPLFLTVPDTARRLRRHEQTVRAMIRRGDLAAIRFGRLIRVLADAVDRAAAVMGRAGRTRVSRRPLRRVPARARA